MYYLLVSFPIDGRIFTGVLNIFHAWVRTCIKMAEWVSTGIQLKVSGNVWDSNKQLSLHLSAPVDAAITRIKYGLRSGEFG